MSTRDLGIEVAENVFGLKRFRDCPLAATGCPGRWGETPEAAICLVNYSSDIRDAWLIIAAVRMWIFSKRLKFKQALQKIVTKRTGLRDGLLGSEEMIILVEPEDICNAALEVAKIEGVPR